MVCGEISERFWKDIKRSARRRKVAFLITPEDAWAKFLSQNRRCVFSGVMLEFTSNGGYRGTASLDRIDHSRSYTVDNIQWVLSPLNLMRGGNSGRFFKLLCGLVAHPIVDPLTFTEVNWNWMKEIPKGSTPKGRKRTNS